VEIPCDIRTIYLYAISFVTLLMVLFGVINSLQAGVDYILQPVEVYAPPVYEKLRVLDPGGDMSKLSELQHQELARQSNCIRKTQLQRILYGIVSICVAFPVYIFHWRKIEVENNHEDK
jgi:hypothetical protein